ncbi:RING/U-box superfamily protein [Actinidia rufa]|uniref:RING/U-box superfamily protein n=1 Tax=Actinidia rufa TaxID=165716 RepID=A0A7J0GZN1_9ERIC|nr:RING/U-box superfamily protein [Actinidia rufa]
MAQGCSQTRFSAVRKLRQPICSWFLGDQQDGRNWRFIPTTITILLHLLLPSLPISSGLFHNQLAPPSLLPPSVPGPRPINFLTTFELIAAIPVEPQSKLYHGVLEL